MDRKRTRLRTPTKALEILIAISKKCRIIFKKSRERAGPLGSPKGLSPLSSLSFSWDDRGRTKPAAGMILPRVVIGRRGAEGYEPSGEESWSSTYLYPIGWSPDNYRKVVLLEGDDRWEMGRNRAATAVCGTRTILLVALLLLALNGLNTPLKTTTTINSMNSIENAETVVLESNVSASEESRAKTADTVPLTADDLPPPPSSIPEREFSRQRQASISSSVQSEPETKKDPTKTTTLNAPPPPPRSRRAPKEERVAPPVPSPTPPSTKIERPPVASSNDPISRKRPSRSQRDVDVDVSGMFSAKSLPIVFVFVITLGLFFGTDSMFRSS